MLKIILTELHLNWCKNKVSFMVVKCPISVPANRSLQYGNMTLKALDRVKVDYNRTRVPHIQ